MSLACLAAVLLAQAAPADTGCQANLPEKPAAPVAAAASFYDPQADARTDMAAALASAAQTGRSAVLVFGAETRGLPQDVLDSCPPERRLRIPMRPDARSLNLSNAVAIAVYEAWRQNAFTLDPR